MKKFTQIKKTGIMQICMCAIMSWGGVISSEAMAQNQVNGFTANAGQMKDTDGALRSDLLFTANAAGAKIYLRQTGISFCWYQAAADSLKKDSAYRMDVDFVNPSSALLIAPSDKQSSYSNYFIGNVSASNVAEYGKVSYQNLWPNIDLLVTADSNGFTYKYHLKKGANPADIKLSYNGGKSFQAGSKLMSIGIPFGKSISFLNPTIKNLSPSKTKNTISTSLNGSKVSSLSIGNYNNLAEYEVTSIAQRGPCAPICNTPVAGLGHKQQWTTYYGGALEDVINDTYLDQTGNIYIVGTTNSLNFPTFLNYQSSINAATQDIVVAKFRPDRSQVFSTYYGGTKEDWGRSIVVNSVGEIYFAAATQSKDYFIQANGPAYVSTGNLPNSFIDGSITKLDANGQSVLWSTYYSNTNQLVNISLAMGFNDKLHMTGCFENNSDQLTTVFSPLSYNQKAWPINLDNIPGFVARFSENDSLEWSSYFSANAHMWLSSCAVDMNNNFYILGATQYKGQKSCIALTNGNVPICDNGIGYSQDTVAGLIIGFGQSNDLIIAKFNPDGALIWSTYYGGSGGEGTEWYAGGNSINVDNNGDVLITGYTQSEDFPGPKNYRIAQQKFGGGVDAFVVRFNSNGEQKFATYIGGSAEDWGTAIAPHAEYGYVAGGSTYSTNFPLLQQIDSYYDNVMVGGEAFMNLYDSNDELKISTYIGGDRNDDIKSIGNFIISGGENLILSGSTSSTNFDVMDIPGTIDYFEGMPQGANDGFIMTFEFCGATCRTTSLVENTKNTASIFPNPTSGQITLANLDKEYTTLTLYSIQGKKILHQDITQVKDQSIDLGTQIPGIYLLKLQGINNVKSYKIVIE